MREPLNLVIPAEIYVVWREREREKNNEEYVCNKLTWVIFGFALLFRVLRRQCFLVNVNAS